jgi:hypothetical protein
MGASWALVPWGDFRQDRFARQWMLYQPCLKIGWAGIGEFCFPHRLPNQPHKLHHGIYRQPAEDSIQTRPAPGPDVRRMKDKG